MQFKDTFNQNLIIFNNYQQPEAEFNISEYTFIAFL